MYPWEIYWLIDAKTQDTPARREYDARDAMLARLKQARKDRGDDKPLSLAQLKQKHGVKNLAELAGRRAKRDGKGGANVV